MVLPDLCWCLNPFLGHLGSAFQQQKVEESWAACFKPPALPSLMCCSGRAEGNGIKLQEAMSLLLSSVWTVCEEGGLWSHVWAKASVRSEINYRDIRWYVRLDWTFPVDSFGAKARKEGRKQSLWPPWIKSFVSFFSGAATMPASCETRPPSPFAPLLLSQTLVSRRGKPDIWTLVALACADEW